MKLFLRWAPIIALALFSFSSCSSEESNNSSTGTPAAPKEEFTIVDGKQELVLQGDDNMKFNTKKLKARANMPIVLTFVHNGKIEKKMMGHNVVFLKEGVNLSEFADKAAQAIDNDYIPKGEEDKIIAHTKMLGGGEKDVIEFTIDKPGVYEYLCTFPGHYSIMRGKLEVVE